MTSAGADGSFLPRLSASIVTYNDTDCLPLFLDALGKQTGVTWEAFFFQNGPMPGACELIREAGLGELFVSAENVGFSRGHNHNLTRCRGRYVLLLNPDLQFGPDLFAHLARFLDEHPEYAIAAPRIAEGPATRPFPPRYFYPGEGMVALERGFRRTEIAWVNGCCMIIRREAFEQLGGFDPGFFLYQSETDLCRRARILGLRIGYAADIGVHHLHRQSQRDVSEYQYSRTLFDGSALFWQKHFEPRDVLRMVRFQYWLSAVLLAMTGVISTVSRTSPALGKARLSARRDVCSEWLRRQHGIERWKGIRPGRIAWRQLGIIREWIVQRRFPLDDY